MNTNTMSMPLAAETWVGVPTTFRLSVDQFHRMIETGVLSENDRVELLGGQLIPMSPIGPVHSCVVARLQELLNRIVPRRTHYVYAQRPVTLGDSEAEPDLTIIRGTPRDFARRHPGPADVVVVIEVADSSLELDRRLKAFLYAAAGLPEYWIVNIPDRQVEVLRDPGRNVSEGTANYRQTRTYAETETLPVIVDGQEFGALAIAAIFDPADDS